MKYYTKEWYDLCQQCSYHLSLRISHKAESFSEVYYQKLYKRKLNEFLRRQKKMSELTADDIYGVESGNDDFNVVVKDNGMTSEECLQVAEDIKKQILEARESYVPPVYDEEALIHISECNHKSYVELLKNTLPKEILEKVADIRVLALNIATKAVKKNIRVWCRNNSKEVNRISREYGNTLKSTINDIGVDIIRNYSFHDCRIVSTEIRGSNFIIELDNAGGFTSINRVTFYNCCILEKENDLQGAIWLYEEIYPSRSGNEYHALIMREGGELAYLTVVASDIEFETIK